VRFADSPGLEEFDTERPFIKKIIDESDLILFLIDDTV
jgi:predicted GTPase